MVSCDRAMVNADPLVERYAQRLQSALRQLDLWLESAQASSAGQPLPELAGLHSVIHGIAGSAASFGFEAIGDYAQAMSAQIEAIRQSSQPSADTLSQLQAGRQRLAELIAQGADSEGPGIRAGPEPVNPSLAPIYVVEDDADLAALIAERLGAHGFDVRLLSTMKALEQAVQDEPPAAILVDVELREGRLHGPQFASNSLVLQAHRFPLVFMSGHDDWQARLAALRAGGGGYVKKPLDFHLLLETLDGLIGQADDEPYRVLVVDDDEDMAELSAMILRQAGMRVEVLTDPSKLLDLLPDFNPEVVLLDLLMPQASGTEVAAMIRQRSPRDPIGIVVLSGSVALSSRVESMLAGSDAYFPKPIDPDMLVAATRGRARRARVQRMAMARDGLTGLNNHATVKLQLDELMALCERNGRPLSVAMIDVDHFKQVNDRHGHLVGDRVLANLGRLLRHGRRRMDVVGRYGGEEFLMVLPDTPAEDAVTVIDRLRQSFARQRNSGVGGDFSVRFSAGIALAREHDSVDQLIARADQALYQAKRGGRDRVELAAHSAA